MWGRNRCSPNSRTIVRSSRSSGVSRESRSSRLSIVVDMLFVVPAGSLRRTPAPFSALRQARPAAGAGNGPIYASSTFAQDGVGGLRGGFEYARTGNPTRAALEAGLAAVEEGVFGRAVSS